MQRLGSVTRVKPEEVDESFSKPSNFAKMEAEDQLGFMIKAMKKASDNLEFETAMQIRDQINELKEKLKKVGKQK